MATRLYLNNQTPPYTPATIRGAWDSSASRVDRYLAPDTTLGGSFTTIAVGETSSSTSFDVLLLRGISRRLAAQTISGTLDLVIGALESNADADFHWHVHAYVTSGDSDTVRGTLLTNYVEAAGVNEWPSSAAGHALSSAQTVSDVTCQDNDRLVIEVGYIARNSLTASRTGTLNYGGSGTDLTVSSANVTTEPGFIEFSGTLSFLPLNARTSQEGIESTDGATPAARVSQEDIESIGGVTPAARVSQEDIEGLGATSNRLGRVSQTVVQAVGTVIDALRFGRVSQVVIETIKPYIRAAISSQQVTEVIGETTTRQGRVSHEVIEVAEEPDDPPTRVSHLGVEFADAPIAQEARVSQVGVETTAESNPVAAVRLSQEAVELSKSGDPAARLSQEAVEAAYIREPLAFVTQLGVEHLTPRPFEGVQVFQLGVETVVPRPFEGVQVYQLGAEVIYTVTAQQRAYAYIIA